jgi:tRNA pseudouridine38-40 synthase
MLKLAFDGANYHGWQVQQNADTVQARVFAACKRIFGDVEKVFGCSRTDAGVHAREYICNFQTAVSVPINNIPYALNSWLPRDISALAARLVDDEFQSRFNCRSKTYIYRINNERIADPFKAGHSFHFPYALDVKLMRKAAKNIIGKHDFSCFTARGERRENHVRTVNFLDVRVADKREKMVEIRINADSYLYNMVRIIAGTLVECGNGRLNPAEIPRIIEGRDRTKAGITLPPHGLFLHEVILDDKFAGGWGNRG